MTLHCYWVKIIHVAVPPQIFITILIISNQVEGEQLEEAVLQEHLADLTMASEALAEGSSIAQLVDSFNQVCIMKIYVILCPFSLSVKLIGSSNSLSLSSLRIVSVHSFSVDNFTKLNSF